MAVHAGRSHLVGDTIHALSRQKIKRLFVRFVAFPEAGPASHFFVQCNTRFASKCFKQLAFLTRASKQQTVV
jgi:hypothetical protein